MVRSYHPNTFTGVHPIRTRYWAFALIALTAVAAGWYGIREHLLGGPPSKFDPRLAILWLTLAAIILYTTFTYELLTVSREELEYTRDQHQRRQRKIRQERSKQLATIRKHLTELRDNGVEPLLREKYADTVPHRPAGNPVGDAEHFDEIRNKAHTLGGAVSVMVLIAHRELKDLHDLWHKYADYDGPKPQQVCAEQLQTKAETCKEAMGDAITAVCHEQEELEGDVVDEAIS